MKRLLRWATLLVAIHATGALAQGQPAWSRAPAAEAELAQPIAPDQILRQGIDRLSGFLMAGGAASPERMRYFLDTQIAPHFDFDYMARWAAGGFYRRLTPDQRNLLALRLRDLFLGALARNLGVYVDPLPDVQVLPARPGRSDHEAIVQARIFMGAGVTMRLEFRFYWNGATWQVFDVSANGASAVAFYRDYFNDRFRRYGPDAALR